MRREQEVGRDLSPRKVWVLRRCLERTAGLTCFVVLVPDKVLSGDGDTGWLALTYVSPEPPLSPVCKVHT